MNIKEKLQALLTASNAATGKTDTTLTDSVQSLIDGYGGGGLPVLMIDSITDTEYTQAEDWLSDTHGNAQHIKDVYMPYISGEWHFYIIAVSNNSAQSYYNFNGGICFSISSTKNIGMSARNSWSNVITSEWSKSRSLWISAGSKIRVVDIKVYYPMGVEA